MNSPVYNGIIFPERAESLRDTSYTSYRVFLNFWEPLANQLRTFYEAVRDRGDTRILLVFGPQGGGKTMFARRIAADFASTPAGGITDADPDNLWHRITGGTERGRPLLDPTLVSRTRPTTSLISVTDDVNIGGQVIPDDKDWMKTVLARASQDSSHRQVIFIDNAERGHFIQSLVDLPDSDFVRLRDQPETTFLAAQRLVGHARSRLRGCLFVVLTNSIPFAQAVEQAINSQHAGMLVRADLPLPGSEEKETVVRVNINRLNSISYWACLDRAGPAEKQAVFSALQGAETFPGSFAAVDSALKSSSRSGRRAKACTLTLLVMARTISPSDLRNFGAVWRDEVDHKWLSVVNYEDGWSSAILNSKDAGLLESEWMLRIVSLGEPFTKALLSGDSTLENRCKQVLVRLRRTFGPGAHNTTLQSNREAFTREIDTWPDMSSSDIDASFWQRGQYRSTIYEPILTRLLPTYNQTHPGFLACRPDYIVEPYRPCSILSAASPDIGQINQAIEREAHVFEFTAMDELSVAGLRGYLAGKLPNYVQVVREQ